MKKIYRSYTGLFKGIPQRKVVFILAMMLTVTLTFAYIFYGSFVAIFLTFPVGLIMGANEAREFKLKSKNELCVQFAEGLNSISASLQAGYSMENSFLESYREMVSLFGKDSAIANQFEKIINALSINISVEDALTKMGYESDIEDVRTFAEIFRFAKRSGGDMVSIIKRTAENIYEKQSVKKEIEVLIAAKKFEQKIMCLIPFVIIIYLKVAMPGMLDPLYGNLTGIVIMSVAMVIYLAAVYLGKRIVRIEV